MTTRIDAIKARLAAATPGPWEVQVMDSGHSSYEMNVWIVTENGDILCDMDGLGRSSNETYSDDGWADAALIANAPADLAWLIARLEEAEGKLAQAEANRSRSAALREACAIGFDAAVACMKYEDGTPVELAAIVNPYRQETPDA